MKFLEKNNVRNELLMANLVGIDTPYAKKKLRLRFFQRSRKGSKMDKKSKF